MLRGFEYQAGLLAAEGKKGTGTAWLREELAMTACQYGWSTPDAGRRALTPERHLTPGPRRRAGSGTGVAGRPGGGAVRVPGHRWG